MPEKYVVIKRDRENPLDQGRLVYGPELKERCQHWLDQSTRISEPMMGPNPMAGYEIRKATVTW